MENLAAFSATEVEQQQSKEKKTSIPLTKDSESRSKKQSHPNELPENRRKELVRWGKRPERKEQLVELVGNQSLSLLPSRSKRGGVRGDIRRGATATRDDPIKYFLPTGGQKYHLSPRGTDGS